jgi:hypothetical protein
MQRVGGVVSAIAADTMQRHVAETQDRDTRQRHEAETRGRGTRHGKQSYA